MAKESFGSSFEERKPSPESPWAVDEAADRAEEEAVLVAHRIIQLVDSVAADGGPEAAQPTQALRQEADRAVQELRADLAEIRESERGPKGDALLPEERARIAKTKEFLVGLLDDEQAAPLVDAVFAPEADGPMAEAEAVGIANDTERFAGAYGEGFLRSVLSADGLSAVQKRDFIRLAATTDAPIDAGDIAKMYIDEDVPRLIDAWKLLRPGRAEEKAEILGRLYPSAEADGARPMLGVAAKGIGSRIVEIGRDAGIEQDEKDFAIDAELLCDFPEGTPRAEIVRATDAMKSGDAAAVVRSVEAIRGAPLAPERRRLVEGAAAKLMEQYRAFADQPSVDDLFGDEDLLPQDELAATERVASAGAFRMHHEGFKKSRRIPPFREAMAKRFLEPMVGYLTEAAGDPEASPDPAEFERSCTEKSKALLAKGLEIFNTLHLGERRDGVDTPIAAIKGFTGWLRSEAERRLASGEGEGEFHVGRDTLTTTYAARLAQEWGTMDAAERRQKIRHVDVSRTVLDGQPRAVVAAYLKSQGVTSRMMGVDGGFSGSGPQKTLMALLSPEERARMEKTKEQGVVKALSPQIKLMETVQGAHERTVDFENKFEGVVEWMENIPKFTERAQALVRATDGSSEILPLTRRRDAASQALAWVVQHGIWREMAPKEVEK